MRHKMQLPAARGRGRDVSYWPNSAVADIRPSNLRRRTLMRFRGILVLSAAFLLLAASSSVLSGQDKPAK